MPGGFQSAVERIHRRRERPEGTINRQCNDAGRKTDMSIRASLIKRLKDGQPD